MRGARRVALGAALAGLLGAALFAVLPYLLSWLNAWVAPDKLTRMSEVGQAYGGPSALLAGIAMIGVTAALAFQIRQFKTGQAIETRKMQIELMRMLVDDPSLRPVSPTYRGVGSDERRRAIFSNLMVKCLELGYEIGYVSRESLELDLSKNAGDVRRRSSAPRWFCAGLLVGGCVVTLSRGRSGPRGRRP